MATSFLSIFLCSLFSTIFSQSRSLVIPQELGNFSQSLNPFNNIPTQSPSPSSSIFLAPSKHNLTGPLVPAFFIIADCGTNNYLGTFARADRRPYGRDFDTHQPTGRFSNGRIAVDYLALRLGIPLVPSNLGQVGSRIRDRAIDFEPCSKLEDLNLNVRKTSKGMEERYHPENVSRSVALVNHQQQMVPNVSLLVFHGRLLESSGPLISQSYRLWFISMAILAYCFANDFAIGEYEDSDSDADGALNNRDAIKITFQQQLQFRRSLLNQPAHPPLLLMCFREDGTPLFEEYRHEILHDRGHFIQMLFALWGERHGISEYVRSELATTLVLNHVSFLVPGWPGGRDYVLFYDDQFSMLDPRDWTTLRGVLITEDPEWNGRRFNEAFNVENEDKRVKKMFKAIRQYGFRDAQAYTDAFGPLVVSKGI